MRKIILVLFVCVLFFCLPVLSDTLWIFNDGTQYLNVGSWDTVQYDSEVSDMNGMHSNIDNNDTVNILENGTYLIYTNIYLNSIQEVAYKIVRIRDNVEYGITYGDHINSITQIATTVTDLLKNDKIKFYVYTTINGQLLPYGSDPVENPRITYLKINKLAEQEMSTEQFNLIFALIAICALFVAVIGTIKIWYFIGGDGQ